jgi:ketosteroid isomerase-like protein
MSNSDIVHAALDAWSRADWATYSAMLTDDFQFGDPSRPMDTNAFLGLGRALLTAFPDWTFHSSGMREEGDKAYNTSRITGTHTGTLAVIPGVAPVAATGKRIETSPSQEEFTLRDGKICRLVITGDAIADMYAQVGAPLQ